MREQGAVLVLGGDEDERLVRKAVEQSGLSVPVRRTDSWADLTATDVLVLSLGGDLARCEPGFTGRDEPAVRRVVVLVDPADEPAAVTWLERGVVDVVERDRPYRLPAALRRAFERCTEMQPSLFERMAEQTTDMLVVTDSAGLTEYANPSFLATMGLAFEDVRGASVAWIYAEGEADPSWRAMWTSLRQAEPWQGRATVRHADGRLYTDAVAACPVRGDDGWALRYLLVFRDMSRMRAVESQVEQAQRMEAVSRLAGGVAHEFNNLLTIIINHAEFLALELGPDSRLTADVQSVLEAARRATGVTRELLAVSQREVIRPRVLDLNETIADSERLVRGTLGESIVFEAELGADLWPVRIDRARFEHALLNLVANARAAMPRGGRLGIATCNVEVGPDALGRIGLAPGRYVELVVSDNGCGMSEEVAARAFEPYYSTTPSGAGLGLSTVYGMVKQAGGDIWLETEEGRGTAVHLLLPACDEPAHSVRPVTDSGVAGGTVLLVEDEAGVRRVAQRILESSGYRVLSAAGGDEALAIAADGLADIDLLVTDVVMPGMSGPELALELTARRADLPVVYMSGYTGSRLAEHGLDVGEVTVLAKPFTAGQLLAHVSEALRDRAAARPAVRE